MFTLRNATLTALFVLLFPGAALADGVNSPFGSLVYGEIGAASGTRDYYSMLLTAVNGDIAKPGILLGVEGNLGVFEYDKAWRASVDGDAWMGSALIGYQSTRDDIYFSVYGGVDLQSITLSPVDLANPVRGERAGAKAEAVLLTGPSKPFYLEMNSSISTAFETYFARVRVGQVVPELSVSDLAIGPEGRLSWR